MDQERVIADLEKNIKVYEGLLCDLSEEEFLWRTEKGKWNLLEILCHLYDEEREDFRTRVALVLTNPETPLPKIDPEGWVTEREYANQNYNEKYEAFIQERRNSIEWLRSLDNPSWRNAFQHPVLGSLSAEMFLANWLAHDLQHIRQILNVKYDFLKETSKQNLLYAGDW